MARKQLQLLEDENKSLRETVEQSKAELQSIAAASPGGTPSRATRQYTLKSRRRTFSSDGSLQYADNDDNDDGDGDGDEDFDESSGDDESVGQQQQQQQQQQQYLSMLAQVDSLRKERARAYCAHSNARRRS